MKRVVFYDVRANPKKVLGAVSLGPDGGVLAEGVAFVKRVASQPVGGSSGDIVRPTDGEKFLDALAFGYQGSAVVAELED